MTLTDYIRDIPDFPKPGILFKDITPLLAHPEAFAESVRLLSDHYRTAKVDAIAAAEARGFLFAAPMALELKRPLIPLRKPGKLPYRTYSLKYDLEYGQAELQMHVDGFTEGARVLLVDDVLATGGTMKACCDLVAHLGGSIVGIAVLTELMGLNGRAKISPLEVHSVLRYE